MRISIVTPSYNQRELLAVTLDSVLSQGYEDLEYVVVDGGSNDGSAELIESCADRLSNWVSEPDNGLYHALNKGFARTSGEVMAWINSSDQYYPWTLRTVAEIFSELPQVQWIMGLPSQFGVSGGPRSVGRGRFNAYDILAGNYRWIQQESVFWRRELWNRCGGHLDVSFRRAADFELWLRFFRVTPLYHVDTVLGGWRVHGAHLGEAGTGDYQKEAETVAARFAADAGFHRRSRARMVRALTFRQDRTHLVGTVLHKCGVWPWYTHPRVVYDFKSSMWTVR